VIVIPEPDPVGVCDKTTDDPEIDTIVVFRGMNPEASLTRIPSSRPTTEPIDVSAALGDATSLIVAVVVKNPAPIVTTWLRLPAMIEVQFW
jgi:hypothetical protein